MTIIYSQYRPYLHFLTTRIPRIPFLSGVFYFYSSKAMSETVVACKLGEAALAHPWKSMFNLLKEGLPQSWNSREPWSEIPFRLCTTPTKETSKPKGNNKHESPDHGGGSAKKTKKHCDLCPKNNGPANTHNTAYLYPTHAFRHLCCHQIPQWSSFSYLSASLSLTVFPSAP